MVSLIVDGISSRGRARSRRRPLASWGTPVAAGVKSPRRQDHMTMQQPQPSFFSCRSSGGSGTLTVCEGWAWCAGVLGLGKGFAAGLSEILGIVEYELDL